MSYMNYKPVLITITTMVVANFISETLKYTLPNKNPTVVQVSLPQNTANNLDSKQTSITNKKNKNSLSLQKHKKIILAGFPVRIAHNSEEK